MVTKGYGLTVEDIDSSCPSDLEPYAEAHRLEMVERDNYIYSVFGNYAISAFAFAIEHNFAKNPKSEYMKNPMLSLDNISNREMSEEEKQKEVDLFFAQENARKVNWKRNKHSKDDSVS